MRFALTGLLALFCLLPIPASGQTSSSQDTNFVSPGRFIAAADIDQIRAERSPSRAVIQAKFQQYKQLIKQRLPAPEFAAVSDAGLALIFATIAAYELKAPVRPLATSKNIDEVLGSSGGIICDQYVSLAIQLFYRIYPQSTVPNVQLIPFGIGRESALDNHATLSAIGTGVPLFVDPTTSIVAPVGFYDLLMKKRVRAEAIVEFSKRDDHLYPPGAFRDQVKDMLANGTLDYRSLLYCYRAQENQYSYGGADYIRSVTWAKACGRPEFWFLTALNNAAWIIRPDGLVAINYGGTASLIPVGQTVYLLTTYGQLWQIGCSWALVQNSEVAEATAGPANQSLYFRTTAGATWLHDGAGLRAANYGGTKSLVGTGDAVHLLTTYGQLWEISSAGWRLLRSDATAITAAYPGRFDVQGGGAPCTGTSTGGCLGEMVLQTSGGDLVWRNNQAVWTTVKTGVRQHLVAMRRVSVNILTTAGEVWRWDTPTTPYFRLLAALRKTGASEWSAVNTGQVPTLLPAIQSLGLLSGWGELYLTGTDSGGAVWMTTAGTW